ncbi:MATE family efflux transporter [Gluconobacter wancherniae]|uniref:Putative multidrug resistance protein NorM n=1 Tax=Gluconobacter wancherniae NBRC 103581 TaxID=656744 RepID=A0A511AZN6_9PROT|nr:MATE family efflux transporter [Gluconobacter wancherniae]MBF0852837.1 MATE family efflux transporter [Gluconobacter wancherniae]GBD56448.1 putative multidrug resistance protein NorM [Gluconobacter wancherniae NBRC 103581]GBR63885.1 Na+ driven multidrug efflux pump [Gluconobacter wancherniae NBRC 103581]GEK92651.1 putative multidrug resistance protein NorM [Gluconobacter wancherniae NBRC 103581]
MTRKVPDPTSPSGHVLTLARVALPLALSQLSEMAMGVTDTVLLGSLGVTELAIGGISNSVFFTTMVTFQTILGGAGIMLSHGRGVVDSGGVSHDGRSIVSAAVALALCVFVPCLLLLLPARELFSMMGEPSAVIEHGSRFIHILLIALLPDLVIIGLFRVILPALGAETLLLWIMPAMALCNGLTNATLIHGWFGLPALGLYGSATATSLTGWAISLALIVLCLARPNIRAVLRPAAVQWPIFKELLKLGLPIMAGAAAEILMFQITGLRAGEFGTQSLAAHQIAQNTASLTFMVCLAIGQAVNVRVSYWRGAQQMVQARRAAITAVGLVLSWSVLTASALLIWPDRVAALYFSGAPPDATTMATTVLLLKIAGIFQLVDGLQTTFTGALRGCGDTVWPMVIGICSYTMVGLGFGGWLAFQAHYGVEGLWFGLAAGLAVTCVATGYRMYRVMWRCAPT